MTPSLEYDTDQKQVMMTDALAPKLFSVLAVSKVMFVQELPAANNYKTVCALMRLEFFSCKMLYNVIVDTLEYRLSAGD